MEALLSAIAFVFGYTIGTIIIVWHNHSMDEIIPATNIKRPIAVESVSTGETYHAVKYKISRKNGVMLRIYNYSRAKYEWYPIWHFKNSLLIMYSIDPTYAMENWTAFIGSNNKK